MKQLIGDAVDRITREEYGGCHPGQDDPCVLKAKVRDGLIQVFCVGKWRWVGGAGKKYPPSKMMQNRAEKTLRMNTGKTFQGRRIQFNWEQVPANVQISPSIDDVRDHLKVMLLDEKSHGTTLNWAINYTANALYAPEHELKDRLIRILGNMTHWRHPQAKQCRNVFKMWIKEH